MLLLALTSIRAASAHQDLSRLVLKGDLPSALRMGLDRYDRLAGAADAAGRALLGQMLGRIMLACGREEDAEELFQQQAKVYEAISRPMVRWHVALDQGALMLHLHRAARAAECFNSVADDRRAPVEVRIEAMAGAAVALHRGGDNAAALAALDAARRTCAAGTDRRIEQLVECIALEIATLNRERGAQPLDDHALCAVYRDGHAEPVAFDLLVQQLGAAAGAFDAESTMVARRMRQLQFLLRSDCVGPAAMAHVSEGLKWIRERQMNGFEPMARIEAALVLIARGALSEAGDILAPLTFNEPQMQRSRYAMELQYCMAKVHQHQGRYLDALRLYRHHSQHAVQALKAGAGQGRRPDFMQASQETQQGDMARMRLPLRYRRAYQYIMEHLNEEHLSVRQVAAHVDVTERALQLAFRTHLGMTPAELIRTRRMERIRYELRECNGGANVLEVASRWGITNRSTLVHNYRSQFDETPSQTLQGLAKA